MPDRPGRHHRHRSPAVIVTHRSTRCRRLRRRARTRQDAPGRARTRQDAPGRARTRERGGAASGARGPRRCSEYPEAACPASPRATLLPPWSRHDVLPVLRRTRRPRCAGLPAMRPRPRGANPRAEDHAPARASPDRAHPLARRAPDRRRPRGCQGRAAARRGREEARGSRGRAPPARARGTAPLARARTALSPGRTAPPRERRQRHPARTRERDRSTARPRGARAGSLTNRSRQLDAQNRG
jgi:hypothetical protein